MDTEILLHNIENCDKEELAVRYTLLGEKLEALNWRKNELEIMQNHIELILHYTQTEINMIINHLEYNDTYDS